MNQTEILYPVFAMVGLTFVVWIHMYVVRLGGMARHNIQPDEMKDKSKLPLSVATSGDNFNNILELPVLFYVAAICLYITDRADAVHLALAWSFVALRAVHSLIHCTYNKVLHRFLVYLSGAICLWTIWGRFIWSILAGPN